MDISSSANNTRFGWICPKCNRVYAPSVQNCFTCNKDIEPTPTVKKPEREEDTAASIMPSLKGYGGHYGY